jgi:hypothetical protein
MHYRGQNRFAQVTAGQFIDYPPNYASVFFGFYWEMGWETGSEGNGRRRPYAVDGQQVLWLDSTTPRGAVAGHGSRTHRIPVKNHVGSGGVGGAFVTMTTTSAGLTTTGLAGIVYSLTSIGPVGGRTVVFLTTTRPVGGRAGVLLTTATCFGLGQQHPVARYAAIPAADRIGRICLFMRQECHIQITKRLG